MSYKTRIQRAFPVWRRLLARLTPMVRCAVVAGGSAGAIAVTGILKGDQLVSVAHYTPGGSSTLADITAEFVLNTDAGQIITLDGYISNASGTDTSSDTLLVMWLAWAE